MLMVVPFRLGSWLDHPLNTRTAEGGSPPCPHRLYGLPCPLHCPPRKALLFRVHLPRGVTVEPLVHSEGLPFVIRKKAPSCWEEPH